MIQNESLFILHQRNISYTCRAFVYGANISPRSSSIFPWLNNCRCVRQKNNNTDKKLLIHDKNNTRLHAKRNWKKKQQKTLPTTQRFLKRRAVYRSNVDM